jgi:hypothetical protein
MSAAMTEIEAKRVVQMCNIVLAAAGLVATVRSLKDVVAVCSSTSIFIATFEALGGERLEGRCAQGARDVRSRIQLRVSSARSLAGL